MRKKKTKKEEVKEVKNEEVKEVEEKEKPIYGELVGDEDETESNK